MNRHPSTRHRACSPTRFAVAKTSYAPEIFGSSLELLFPPHSVLVDVAGREMRISEIYSKGLRLWIKRDALLKAFRLF